LIPVLEEILLSFPFVIRGFHSDNGSEYINRYVAELLNKLLIEEHTKSRSRNSNDNAQAESKNGSIVCQPARKTDHRPASNFEQGRRAI
jgi:transposase InsO family protein